MHLNLSVASFRATSRLNVTNLWDVVVEVLNWSRPHVLLEGEPQVNEAWLLDGWADAFDLSGRYEFAWYKSTATKVTSYLPRILEVYTRHSHFRASSDWALTWLHIEKKRGLVVVEDLVIISVLDTVEGDLYSRLVPVVARG